MLIETISALVTKLKSINNDITLKNMNCSVTVLMDEKYREIIAVEEKLKQIVYPLIIIHDSGSLSYDGKRYSNDVIDDKYYNTIVNPEGQTVVYYDIMNPLLPYNLEYKIEIICKQRIQLDAILIWFLRNIHNRDYLEVKYKDEIYGDCTYDAIVKRSDFVKADEPTSSTLYRRICELRITTLLENSVKEHAIQIKEHKPNFYQV